MRDSKLEDTSYFLQRFLRSPKHIASVVPSSRFLAKQMLNGLPLADGDVVIEYGPGTGSFTREVRRLRDAGTKLTYLGVEKDPGMHRFLTRRFSDMEFVLGDALNVRALCRSRGLPPATAVISGLPLILMESNVLRGIVDATRASLQPDGVFRTFSYVHSYPSRGAGVLRDAIQQTFEEYDLSKPVVRNLPPAFLLTGRKPRQTVYDVGESAAGGSMTLTGSYARLENQALRGSRR